MTVQWTTEQFIKRANEVWNNKFDYSRVEYTGMINKVIIICPKHGKFTQKAGNHIDGRDCSKCSRLKSNRLWYYLKRNHS